MSVAGAARKSLNKSTLSHDGSTSRPRRKSDRESIRPKTILLPTKQPPLFFDGLDVTPISLNPYIYEGGRERQLSILETLAKEDGFATTQSLQKSGSQKFHTNILMQKQEMETAFTHRSVVTSAYFADDIVIPVVSTPGTKSELWPLAQTESMEEVTIFQPIPENITLNLIETETIFLLNLPSCTVWKNSEEAEAVEDDNKLYEHLTKGKGRNRKVLNVGVQTIPVLKKGRDVVTGRLWIKHHSTFVSTWEMFDTFNENEEKLKEDDEQSDDEDEETGDFHLGEHGLNDEVSLESYRMSIEDKQLIKIVKSKAFQDALTVIERILGNNCYNSQQKRFKGLSDPDPFREQIEYKYRLEKLWDYSNDDTRNKCVTGIDFNVCNEDIVAVAYGKYYYSDRDSSGMVMIWNIKNPRQPERQYNFQNPVTCLSFSQANPNLLSVGFYNGQLKILDVSKREIFAIREDCSYFEPIWSIVWFRQGEEEDVMVAYGDGKVCRYQITSAEKLKRTQVMVAANAEGKLKGINYLKKCEGKQIPISGYDQATCLAFHPCDPFIYFVGTSEGVIHRCSTNYYNEHVDLFKAHSGSVHCIKWSPFANKLFLTAGDDFRGRIWIDGISEPINTSPASTLPVLDVAWSTTHSTIFAGLRGADIHVLDIQRKLYEPQSNTKISSNVLNVVCRFTPNGRCLLVGDIQGTLHVYSLEDLPNPPFFQEHLLLQSLKKLLVTKPELLKKVRKVGKLNFEKQNKKYFN